MIQKCWYYFVWTYIKVALFFYLKSLKVYGQKNIPKKGAVLFAVNHPNGLIDPLLVSCATTRTLHFLVRAGAFTSPLIKKLLASLNLMPIYRIRDGVQQLSKNDAIFEQCYKILNSQKGLMIFPEGSHNRKRSIRTLSKGFTRIIFGALERNPALDIQIVPVGLTYQNASVYPTKVAVHFGEPISAGSYYQSNHLHKSTLELKEVVSQSLQKLSVHIPENDEYTSMHSQLVSAQVDFTKVEAVNAMIASGTVETQSSKISWGPLLKIPLIINTFFPWLLWKQIHKKITEIEFVDTFRFGVLAVLVPLFYSLQSVIVYFIWGATSAGIYGGISLLLVLLYTKTSTTPPG